MTAEIAERLGSRLTTAEYRQVAVGIGREVVGERFAAGYNKQLDGRSRAAGASGNGDVSSDEDEDGEDPLELQNGRSTAIGIVAYAVQADIVQGLNPRSIDVFRTLSLAWHAFLRLSAKAAEGVGLVEEQERKRKQALSCLNYSTRLQPQLQPQPEHETTQQPEAKRAKLTQAYQANTRTTTEKQLTDAVRQVLCIPIYVP
jgi:hypothetical protein